jgi:hypothetical protein
MKILKKKEIAGIYLRCLNLVRRKPPEFVLFKKLRCYGICDYEKDVLEIDHRKDMLRTAYHECVHYLFPEWSETQVLYTESRLINNTTILENARFLKHLSIKLYKSALQQSLKMHRRKRAKRSNKNETRNSGSRGKRR